MSHHHVNNITSAENLKQGTTDWQITEFQYDYPETMKDSPLLHGLRSSAIEGYASRTSVYPGESIDFMVSTSPASPFEADIYRIGYYGAQGGRHLLHLGLQEGIVQPVPDEGPERLRSCQWQPSLSLQIPDDWVSGVYLVKLTRKSADATLPPAQSYIIFVVKQQRQTQILVQVSDLTWQAYNKWPDTSSLYDDGSRERWFQGTNVRVSFDRPYTKYCQVLDAPLSLGSGEFLLWEYPLAYWLEAEGYDVTYCSNLDLHYDPSLLEHCQVFISIGHDEYWTRQMYDNAAKARDEGVSLLFFSGNALYHEIIEYEDQEGKPFRSYARKHRMLDEYLLMGAASFGPGYGDWTVVKPEHWIFAGTGMKAGDSIPDLIGWEYHGLPVKAIEGLEILAHSDLIRNESELPRIIDGVRANDLKHAAVIYPGPRNNWVFNAGTIWWAEGLSDPPGHISAMEEIVGRVVVPDARVQQMTRNLLERCLSNSEKGDDVNG